MAEDSLPRVIWKGAIAFGLVHVPVALYSATHESSLDFEWLDKRSMDPVGYQRINKVTGTVIEKENVVKGLQYESGRYVVMADEEIRAAFPKATQTVEIESFVKASDVPSTFFEKPYFVVPINRGAKVFALLRETLESSQRIGIARVVISNKQHLAALYPMGKLMVLNLLRWSEEVRLPQALLSLEGLTTPVTLTTAEKQMATQLVKDLSGAWNPTAFKDEFKDEILRMVGARVKAGDTTAVTKLDSAQEHAVSGAEIIDLVDLLKRSLAGGKKATRLAATEPELENNVAASVLNKRVRQSSAPAPKPIAKANSAARKKRSA